MPSEKVLWTGRPHQREKVAHKYVDERIFVLAVGVILLALIYALGDAPLGFVVCLLAMLAIYYGWAGILAGRRWNAVYAVTNERVIAVCGTRFASLPLAKLKVAVLGNDGSLGTLHFGGWKEWLAFIVPGWPGPALRLSPLWYGTAFAAPGFSDIPGPETVKDIIVAAQEAL